MWRSAFLVGLGCGGLAALLVGWPGASSQWLASDGASLLGLWDLWFATQQGLGEGLHTQLTRFPEGEVLAPALVGELPLAWLLVKMFGLEGGWSALFLVRTLAAGMGAALLLSRHGRHPALGILFALAPPLLGATQAGLLSPGALAWLPWTLLVLSEGPRPALRSLGATWLFLCHPATMPLAVVGLLCVQRRSARSLPTLGAVLFATAAWAAIFLQVDSSVTWSHYSPLLPLAAGLETSVSAPLSVACWAFLTAGASLVVSRYKVGIALVFVVLAGPWPSWSSPPTSPTDTVDGAVLTYPPRDLDVLSLYWQTRHGQSTSAGRHGPPLEEYTALVNREGWSPNALRRWATEQGFSTFMIDTGTVEGRAPALALLIGGSVSNLQAAHPWPEIPQRASSDELLFEPVPPPSGEGDLHPPESDWQHPDLAWVLDASLLDRAELHVRVYTSVDGLIYSPLHTQPIAHSMTSLGLSHRPDGALEISGIVRRATWRRLGLGRAKSGVNTLTTLTTPDLERWGVRRYTLNQAARIVDPEIQHGPEGPTLIAWTTSRLAKGGGIDPVLFPEPHEILSAELSEDGVLEPGEVIFSGLRLADPVRVGNLLYATQLNLVPRTSTRILIAKNAGDGFVEAGSIHGLSVPYVWKDGDTWRMLAHQALLHGTSRVVELLSDDGLTWSNPVGLAGLDGNPRCESPVGTRFQRQLIVVCSHQVKEHRSASPSRPPRPRNQ